MSEHYNGLLGNLATNNCEISDTTNEYEFGKVVLGHAKGFHSLLIPILYIKISVLPLPSIV